MFNRIKQANLKLNHKKCCLFKPEVKCLEHAVSGSGVSTDPEKTEHINKWSIPKNVKEIQRFLGLCSYYRKFVKDFSKIANLYTNSQRKDTYLCGQMNVTLLLLH